MFKIYENQKFVNPLTASHEYTRLPLYKTSILVIQICFLYAITSKLKGLLFADNFTRSII